MGFTLLIAPSQTSRVCSDHQDPQEKNVTTSLRNSDQVQLSFSLLSVLSRLISSHCLRAEMYLRALIDQDNEVSATDCQSVKSKLLIGKMGKQTLGGSDLHKIWGMDLLYREDGVSLVQSCTAQQRFSVNNRPHLYDSGPIRL